MKDAKYKFLTTKDWLLLLQTPEGLLKIFISFVLSYFTGVLAGEFLDWITLYIALPEVAERLLRLVIVVAVMFLFVADLMLFLVENLMRSKLFNAPEGAKLLSISNFLYSKKTHKEVFEPLVGDWREEYFEALQQKREWKARWISVRYSYAFLAAMCQRSPLGDLLEFVRKFAK